MTVWPRAARNARSTALPHSGTSTRRAAPRRSTWCSSIALGRPSWKPIFPSLQRAAQKALSTGSVISVVFAGVVDAGRVDVVLLHQLAEVLAIDVGVARRVGDVAVVALEQRQDVVALEARHPL